LKRLSHRKDHQSGLTLIELMVSVLLALMLTSGLFYMMSSQQKTYTSQLSALDSQENLWGAMEYIQGQIRKAGYGWAGCITDPTNGIYAPVVQRWNGVSLCTNIPEGCVMPDPDTVAINVANGTNFYTGVVYASGDGPDSFSVAYASDPNARALTAVRLASRAPEATAFILTNSPGTPPAPGLIVQGDLLVLWQHGSAKFCTMIEVSGPPTDTNPPYGPHSIPFAYNGGLYNPENGKHDYIFHGSGYAPSSLVMKVGTSAATDIKTHFFAIDDTGSQSGSPQSYPPRLVTFQQDSAGDPINLEVIAENIEDMQISWACDQVQDGTLDEGTNAGARVGDDWAHNVASDTLPACSVYDPIKAVRITLIARTTSTIQSKIGHRPASEDRAAGTAAQDQAATGNMGTFGRAVLTSIVKPRNIRRSIQ